MTDDEFFAAVYLVCGSLPSKPDTLKMFVSMSSMYQRKLRDGRIQSWLVDDETAADSLYDMRAVYDPAYMEYFDKAARLGMTMMRFRVYLAWAEAYERTK
jgi:hypothetical protein